MMSTLSPEHWTDTVRQTLQRYDEALLRRVAASLLRSRGQWPVEDLIDKSVATLGNAAVIDRRLRDLDSADRRLLSFFAHSRQPCWRVASLIELSMALGSPDGLQPILATLEAGLLFPVLSLNGSTKLKGFENWLTASGRAVSVFAHPSVSARALGESLELADFSSQSQAPKSFHESDGLEWPMRLAAFWQLVTTAPLRRTQQGEFFKRDLERMTQDAVLSAAPAEGLVDLPDRESLLVALAIPQGIVEEVDGEVQAKALPEVWEEGLPATLASFFASFPHLEGWTPLGRKEETASNPFPSASLLSLLLLSRLQEDAWASVPAIEDWLLEHHPYWSESKGPTGITAFLLGLAYQLRVVVAARDAQDHWMVRLSSLGRWLLGLVPGPPPVESYAQTLLVQPNLEIVAYRQGMTPSLIGKLSRFAAWKSLGAACTLQLQADTVYRAMESGLTFEDILRVLEQHGMRALPPAVVESLRTWANKRERISVYPSAALFEFATVEDLNAALARGLPATRLSDRLAVVSSENDVDYRNFRLTGTRDYALPPEKCVEVEADGVTLSVDLARLDLLLETELQRFGEALDAAGVNGRRRYQLTPTSLAAGRDLGLDATALEMWFQQRTGQPLAPAARLLLTGAQASPPLLRRRLVLHVTTSELADGLQQWPGTRSFFSERLGPTALAVEADLAEELRERLRAIGMNVDFKDE